MALTLWKQGLQKRTNLVADLEQLVGVRNTQLLCQECNKRPTTLVMKPCKRLRSSTYQVQLLLAASSLGTWWRKFGTIHFTMSWNVHLRRLKGSFWRKALVLRILSDDLSEKRLPHWCSKLFRSTNFTSHLMHLWLYTVAVELRDLSVILVKP